MYICSGNRIDASRLRSLYEVVDTNLGHQSCSHVDEKGCEDKRPCDFSTHNNSGWLLMVLV